MEEEEGMLPVDDSQKALDVAWMMVLRVLVEVGTEVDQVERLVEEVNLLTHPTEFHQVGKGLNFGGC